MHVQDREMLHVNVSGGGGGGDSCSGYYSNTVRYMRMNNITSNRTCVLLYV